MTGKNFDHRRGWIEARMIDLADSFAVSLYAWAAMSNHTHLVLFIDPGAVEQWSDTEVAERWTRINRTLSPDQSVGALLRQEDRRLALLNNPARLLEIRDRLGSLSWFMRFLNEAVALAANREDGCTGRFWEGRFHCKALKSENALLGAMAYSDLNPVRAGLANGLQDSRYTGIHRRLLALNENPETADEQLEPLSGPRSESFPVITTAQYVALADWTGRIVRIDKSGYISGPPPDWLGPNRDERSRWLLMAVDIEKTFGAAIGDAPALQDFAEQTGRRWIRGVGTVR